MAETNSSSQAPAAGTAAQPAKGARKVRVGVVVSDKMQKTSWCRSSARAAPDLRQDGDDEQEV
jgi:hypothetical protein